MTSISSSAPQISVLLEQDAVRLAEFIEQNAPVMVLTGAGISTASGIPEYRDEEGNWKHSKPVQYKDFMETDHIYRRYWARSSVGWQNMGNARPNAAHHALAKLQQHNLVDTLITQNVDRLHEQAGSRRIINLHGHLGSVSCQSCVYQVTRDELQQIMQQENNEWFLQHHAFDSLQKPDGDAEVTDQQFGDFCAPRCPECDGKIKPDVVFFGETIPGRTIEKSQAAQQSAKALLVIGSSLMVFSGFRIVRDFCARNLPVTILNKGKTRADELVNSRFTHDASVLLPLSATHLNL